MAPNAVPAPLPLPLPRRPLAVEGTTAGAEGAGASADDAVRRWYGEGLGWATVPGTPVRLITGLRFDVLDVPRGAGAAGLRHLRPGAPVALHGDRMRLLVAAGSAEELPGLLEWLEWGSLPLDLRALGAGDGITAPAPASAPACARAAAPAVAGSQGAAVGCGPPCRDARWSRRCRRSRRWAAVGAPPTSYDWWRRWPRSATASGCGAWPLSRWPSRRPRGSSPGPGRGR